MTKADSQIGKIFTNLFDGIGQETEIVSPAFRVDKSLDIRPTIQTYGDLDGGLVVLQILKSGLTESSADNTANSTDWQDTDDIIIAGFYATVEYSRRPHRLKVTNSGASADFSVDVNYNL